MVLWGRVYIECVMGKGGHGLCHGEGEQGLCHGNGCPWIVSWGRVSMDDVMGKVSRDCVMGMVRWMVVLLTLNTVLRNPGLCLDNIWANTKPCTVL